MEIIFCETKKVCALLLILLLISSIIVPTSNAGYLDYLQKDKTYEYTGYFMIAYKDKYSAKISNIFKRKAYLRHGDKIVIKEIDGNIIKIDGDKYIKISFLNSISSFKDLSDSIENPNNPEQPEIPQKPEILPQDPQPQQPSVTTINVDSIQLNKTEANLYDELNCGEYTFKVTITPENATNKNLIWSSDNPKIVTVDQNGKIKWQSVGTATITAATQDGTKKASCIIHATKLLLNNNSLTLNVGDTSTLFVKYAHNNKKKDVTWTSSNAKIVKVDENGNVKAIAKGNATITAKAVNTIEKKCNVEVKNVAVKKVTLNQSSLDIGVNNTAKLIATIYPENATNKDVTWISSNSLIASVENGKIKGNKQGKATITVKTKDGKKTAKCVVNVIKKVTGVKLDKTTLNMYIGQETKLNATVTPGNASNINVTWSSKNPNVATVDKNGKIKAIAEGTTTIKVKTNEGGKEHECTVTVDPYKYYNNEFDKNVYTLAVKLPKLKSVLATIDAKNIAQKYGGRGYCNAIATSHIYMLLGKVSESLVVHDGSGYSQKHPYYGSYSSYFNKAGTEKDATYVNMKADLDRKKPLRLHVYSGKTYHWVTVVGYKNNCTQLSDLLILSTWHGYLVKGGEADALSLWSDYDYRIYN